LSDKKKINCWEYKKCGRQPGGENVDKLGVCFAAMSKEYNGVHDGENGGRACWVVAGTLCGGKVQGTFASKIRNCVNCEFYKKVRSEEKENFKKTADLILMKKD